MTLDEIKSNPVISYFGVESGEKIVRAVEAFHGMMQERMEDLRAALAAPATAPEPICTKCGDVITAHDPGLCGCCLSTRDTTTPVQPSWQDAPTKPGMWACLYMGELSTAIFNAYEIEHFDRDEMVGCRWRFIPEDKQ